MYFSPFSCYFEKVKFLLKTKEWDFLGILRRNSIKGRINEAGSTSLQSVLLSLTIALSSILCIGILQGKPKDGSSLGVSL